MSAGRSNCLSCLRESRFQARPRHSAADGSSRTLEGEGLLGQSRAAVSPDRSDAARAHRRGRAQRRDAPLPRPHGLGPFIARPSIDYDILHLRALAGDLSALGEDVATRFVRSYKTVADRRVAEALRLRERAPVFVLERLRLVDGEPVSFQASYLPAPVGGAGSKADPAVTTRRQR